MAVEFFDYYYGSEMYRCNYCVSGGTINAIPDLRHDTLQAELSGVLEHRLPIDFEAFAELDVCAADDLLEWGLALMERQLPEVSTVQKENVECDQDDLRRLTFKLVLQHREVGGAVGGGYDDLAVEDCRRRLDVPGVVAHLLETVSPVIMSTPGEDLDGLVGQVDLNTITVELDLVDPTGSRRHLRDQ